MTIAWQCIRFVVFDFDGVFTDNRVVVNERGEEAVICYRGDGLGLARLKKIGVDAMILSTETNPVVGKRAEKLKLYCLQSCEDKLATLRAEAARRGLALDQVAFLGNDINDLDCLRSVGFPMVVNDAESEVIDSAKYVTRRRGGYGAVREVCDLLYRYSAKESQQ